MTNAILVALMLACSAVAVGGQTSGKTMDQSEIMKQLLAEVRQLRGEVRSMAGVIYRAQSAVLRLRMAQDQVNRIESELGRVRTQLGEVRTEREEFKSKLPELQGRFDKGLVPEEQVIALKSMVERFEKTESNLAEREYQLTGELASARNAVLELNRRVDEAELEIVKMSTTPKPSPPLE